MPNKYRNMQKYANKYSEICHRFIPEYGTIAPEREAGAGLGVGMLMGVGGFPKLVERKNVIQMFGRL